MKRKVVKKQVLSTVLAATLAFGTINGTANTVYATEVQEQAETEPVEAGIFVEKVEGYDAEQAIRGADVSTYIVLMETFAELNKEIENEEEKLGFRDWDGKLLDEQGFFNLLADSGLNYIRTRVWNDPYDVNGKGYGGGNNDLEKAISIGQWATNAGMRNLIDFHLSDFWADPSKQFAPKAWEGKTVEEKVTLTAEYITSSLEALHTNGVDVGMVQIGNETNNGVAGVDDWEDMKKIFDAGCDAVHAFNEENGTDIKAVLHFTNPEKTDSMLYIAENLANYDGNADGETEGVSYDVFATSYYPSGHGTLENLQYVLDTISSTYDKYVMVAETSWATSLEDGDGAGNGFSTNEDIEYDASVQWQAHEVRDVIATVNEVDTVLTNGERAALGMFYWELAWLPTQYAYDEEGNYIAEIHEENKVLWEEFGAGWAASYASDYDPNDAGRWYGGNPNDNQTGFDFVGNPLESLKVFKYVTTGAVTELAVADVKCENVTTEVGKEFTVASLPAQVQVTYNNREVTQETVTWNDADIKAIADVIGKNESIGLHTVNGTLQVNGEEYTTECTVNVMPQNVIQDSSFEQGKEYWTVEGKGGGITKEDPRTETYSMHFWADSDFSWSASQTLTVEEDGMYNAYIYMQGLYEAGSRENERIYISIETPYGIYESENVMLNGYAYWLQPEITDIPITAGSTVKFIIHGDNMLAGAWGSMDDACLYRNAPLEESVKNSLVELPKVEEETTTVEVVENVVAEAETESTVVEVEQEEADSNWMIYTVVAAVLVLAIACVVVMKKRRK